MLSRSGTLLIRLAWETEGLLSWAFLTACQLLCGWLAPQSSRSRCMQRALRGPLLLHLLRHRRRLHHEAQPMAVKVFLLWLAMVALL